MKFFFIAFFLLLFVSNTNSVEIEKINLLKDGGNIIFIRHSLAPGGGDPMGFDLYDCKTQRNLNLTGINQSRKIGKIFIENKIPVDQVLSSQWCRCKDTAKYAFGDYKEFKALNSTFSPQYKKNEKKQLNEISEYVKNWKIKNKNLILITHYSIITAITDANPSSGEIVVTDKKFNVLFTILTN